MFKTSKTLDIELSDANCYVLCTYAYKLGKTLEEYISEILQDHVIELLLKEDNE